MSLIEGIFGFYEDPSHRFLSNFWLVDVVFDGVHYPSVEHAYQAAKTLDLEQRKQFERGIAPGLAKKLGRSLTIRPDWEQVKVDIMRSLLRQKFSHTDLAEWLVDTGDLYIEETNWWGDTFWGVCKGKGKNVLGNLLMHIRKELVDFPSEWL